jgi:hypothetical protein
LAADLALRYGSRRTLFWQLPPGDEVAFVDLVALRLPHRLLGYADELPAAPTAPPDLEGRSRKARLLLELAKEGPSIAPSLPLPALAASDRGELSALRSQAECAERCQSLSTALLSATAIAPSDAAVLRAEYHEAMVAALKLQQGRPAEREPGEIRLYETLAPQLNAETVEAGSDSQAAEGAWHGPLFQETISQGSATSPRVEARRSSFGCTKTGSTMN